MNRFSLVMFVLAGCLVTALHGQTPAPKPDPEFKKLQVLVGHWTYDGEYKPGPLGAGAKIKGEWTYQFILKGFVLEGHATEKADGGETHYLEIDEYDPGSKKISMSMCGDDGSRYSGVIISSGNTLTWEGRFAVGGKEYKFREPFVMSADLMSGTARGEISIDGKTWVPFFEGKFTKIKPVAKR